MSRRGLFVDLDGTLVDSIPAMKMVYRRFLEGFGAQGTDEEFDELNGPPLNRVVEILRNRHKIAASSSDLLRQYERMVKENYLSTKPNPGAPEVLAHALSLGWKCAVVTSNSASLAREWVLQNNLVVTDIIGKESIRIGKPDPEPYLIALQQLNCEARISVAVEDSAAGLKSALAAGLLTFAFSPSRSGMHVPAECKKINAWVEIKPWLEKCITPNA